MVGVQFGLDTVEFASVGGWGGWISVAEGVSAIRFRQLEMVRSGIDTELFFLHSPQHYKKIGKKKDILRESWFRAM